MSLYIIAFVLLYLVPLIGISIASICSIFSWPIAKELNMFHYGHVISGIIFGLVPVINLIIFYTHAFEKVKAPNWWWFHRNTDISKYD